MATKTTGKTITIASVIDVVGALATDSLNGQVYFMDSNKANGSTEQGTENLKTMVQKGDRLVWTVIFLECEAYAAIDDIIIDKDYCEPKKEFYEGTDVSYWIGTVKKDVTMTRYSVKFQVGTRAEPIETTSSLCLVGQPV
ncbi:MAG: hypothetical protein WAN66_07630 [Limnoraphis robusta]|jgi:hypothetical protein|uniref:hypothetical protein n=1 Tax=Limnoraphis robusta TaxID=1118279 RepID=UPI00066C8DB3|nr:hypothetical protein [Limnoraphis robusta]